MKSRWVVAVVAMCLLGSTGGAADGGQTAVPDSDTAAIRSLIETYARTVDTADTTLASTIWASTSDVSFIHPRGHERGWPAIRTRFYEQTMGALFSARRLTVKDLAVHTYGDTAWAEFYWDFAATSRKDGSPVVNHGRETQIYRKVNGAWRIVHVHYSGLPVGQ